ncbi:unnamed protein product [Durusdinium trenchii]|uniref:Fe2OG dioxygenase domain-containing protein n=1 Tax=Durusdinium trenchii TaxID=1381693 RepID=A0ABP0N7L3_9DINO
MPAVQVRGRRGENGSSSTGTVVGLLIGVGWAWPYVAITQLDAGVCDVAASLVRARQGKQSFVRASELLSGTVRAGPFSSLQSTWRLSEPSSSAANGSRLTAAQSEAPLRGRMKLRRAVAKLARKRMRWGGKEAVPGRRLGGEVPSSKELVPESHPVENIFTIPDTLRPEEAEALIAKSEEAGFEVQTSRGPAYGEALRHHWRISFDDPRYAQALWDSGLGQCLKQTLRGPRNRQPIGLNENIRIYKYSGGDVFGQHVDGSNQTSLGQTEYTLLVYLSGVNEGLVGGETVFYSHHKEVLRVTPKTGMALVHRHGRECLLHESLEVKEGVKYVLRSDVVFG